MNHTQIQENIQGLLEKAGFPASEVVITYDEKTNTLWFSVNSSNARFLLGRGGEALNAINHLATKVVEKMFQGSEAVEHSLSQEERMASRNKMPRIIVDANDFEKKKIENLRTVAHMMAERARYFKSSIDVDAMPPHERRIVHEFLSDIPDISTESTGEGKIDI